MHELPFSSMALKIQIEFWSKYPKSNSAMSKTFPACIAYSELENEAPGED